MGIGSTLSLASVSHSRSFKVIENCTIWKRGDGFLFVFYSNYGCIFSHFCYI